MSSSDQFGASIGLADNVRKVAVKLAEYVAKNGRSFEGVTRDRNPGNTPFRYSWPICHAHRQFIVASRKSMSQASTTRHFFSHSL